MFIIQSYQFLFQMALILLSTKVLGLFSRKLKMPQVVGALLAGLILGPAVFNVIPDTEFMRTVAELGVIILMFSAGLETDVVELRKAGKASLVIAMLGVVLPLAGGVGVGFLFNRGPEALLQNVFLGVVFTATSVSITVEVLRELGKLDTRVGSAILGAALIDDILGIIALTLVTSFAGENVNTWIVVGKIVFFFVFLAVVGFLFYQIFGKLMKIFRNDMRRFAILAFVFCLAMAYCAEEFFGVADITGAYFAGLIISNTQKTKYIASRFDTMSFLLFSPVFFASIGLKVVMPALAGQMVLLSALMLAVAVLTKFLGCGLGAHICGYSKAEAAQIGAGMAARGEVALIIASKGAALGLMQPDYYGAVILMVMATAVVAPVFLKAMIGRSGAKPYSDLVESPLVDSYRETEQFDLAQQQLLEIHQELKQERKPRETQTLK